MNSKTYSITTIAAEVGRTPLRIRQICQKKNLGYLINPRMRILTVEEAEIVRETVKTAKPGPKPKKI